MKLLICVVNRDDLYPLNDTLVHAGYDATMISTTGGFLREGNATLLIGIQDESVANVLEIIRNNCRTRTKLVTPLPPDVEYGEALMLEPIEVQVGGATIFIVNVERFVKF
ncbi:MAG: cyclic-di-AMP receptor [Anaerolineae bacterium]|nr:cyclic-di-AMP receptor [Anaerolineae bacterium]